MITKRLLVVEGPDDKHVLWAILNRHQFNPEFEIEEEGGFENVRSRLAIYLKPGTDLERLGVVVDADTDIRVRWEAIMRTLSRAGYQDVLEHPDPAGTVIEHGLLPRVGVWIMPNNAFPGMLEDYLCFLVPPGDALFERATRCIDGIPLEERRFSETQATKALIHTWLAWQDDPGTPLGQAITKRYIQPEGNHIEDLLDWLTRLFA